MEENNIDETKPHDDDSDDPDDLYKPFRVKVPTAQDYEALFRQTPLFQVKLIVGPDKKEIVVTPFFVAKSSYLKKFIKRYPADPVILAHLDANAVQGIHDMVYTEERLIFVEKHNVYEILAAADFLEFEGLKAFCIGRLKFLGLPIPPSVNVNASASASDTQNKN